MVPPFDNTVNGPAQAVTISGGQTTTVAVTVPYQALGGVTGTIKVTGKGTGTPVTSYTVLACPGSAATTSPECINEYSGPGGFGYLNTLTRPAKGAGRKGTGGSAINQYQLATLTPGPWTLYPGYGTRSARSPARPARR